VIISIFALLLLLGLCGTTVGVVVVAIVTRKLWLIPAGAAIVVLGLMALGIIGSLFVGFASHGAQSATIEKLPQLPSGVNSVTFPTQTITYSQPPIASSQPAWRVNITWLLVLGVVLVAAIVRRVFGPPHGHGILRAWPVLVVLGFFAVCFLLKVNSAYEHSALNAQMAREAAEANAAQARFAREQEQQQIAKSKIEAAARKQLLQRHPNAETISQKFVGRSGEPTDINELMDQFDLPRIPVSPELPTPPAPPSPSAAPPAPTAPFAPAPTSVVAVTNADNAGTTASISVETKKIDTKKSSTGASQKRKKSKSSNSDGTKTASQAVAASKANNDSQKQKSAAEKESKLDAEAPLVSTDPSRPTARPAWIDDPPKRTGNTRREVIATDEYTTVEECYQAADIYLLLKTYAHMQELANRPYTEGPLPSISFHRNMVTADGLVISAGQTHGVSIEGVWVDPRLQALGSMGIGIDYVRRELVAKDSNGEPREFVDTVDRHISLGPMKKLYVQIEFTPALDRELRQRWEGRQRAEGFKFVSVGAFSLLGLLGCVFALLKVDTWTKGYYTKRLFIGVPAAIIGSMFMLAVLGWLVGR
jgi:hypothetical protein